MEKYLEILRKSGSKVTKQRKMVLDILLRKNQPMSQSEIFGKCTDIDFASVFRTIQLFLSIGIVHKINMCDNKIRYEIAGENPHHHISCSKCGKIESIDLCIVDDVQKMTDYNITNHTMEFQGICPDCKTVN